jgi:hypothetical protein
MPKKKSTHDWRDAVAPGAVRFGSLAQLQEIVAKKQGVAFVWPDEGTFDGPGGEWAFNADHEGEFEPLWIDPTTAGMLIAVYDALNDENKAKFAALAAEGRGSFAFLVESAWERVGRAEAVPATMENLRAAANGQGGSFLWPDDAGDAAPLAIDAKTARRLVDWHDAQGEAARDGIAAAFAATRANFQELFMQSVRWFIDQCITKEPGWFVQAVMPDADGTPAFAYTIGLHENFGAAEVLMVGFDPALMHDLLNGVARLVKDGTKLEDWGRSARVVRDYDVVFRELPLPVAREWARGASERYRPGDFRLLQMFLPDANGKFPWDDGVAEAYRRLQGVLLPEIEAAAAKRAH